MSTPQASSTFVLGFLFITSFRYFLLSVDLPRVYLKYVKAPLDEFIYRDVRSLEIEDAEKGFGVESFVSNRSGGKEWNGQPQNTGKSAMTIRLGVGEMARSKLPHDPLGSLAALNAMIMVFSLTSFGSLLSFPRVTQPESNTNAGCSFLIAVSVLCASLIRLVLLSRTFWSIRSFSEKLRMSLLTTTFIPSFPSVGPVETGLWWGWISLRAVLAIVITALDTAHIVNSNRSGLCTINFNRPVGAVMDSVDLVAVVYLGVRWSVLIWGKKKVEGEGGFGFLGGAVSATADAGKTTWRWLVRDLVMKREMVEVLLLGVLVLAGFASWLGEGNVQAFWIPQTLALLLLLETSNTPMIQALRTTHHSPKNSNSSQRTLGGGPTVTLPALSKPTLLNNTLRHTPQSSTSSTLSGPRFPAPTKPAPVGPLPPLPSASMTPLPSTPSKGKKKNAVDFTEEILSPMTTKNLTNRDRRRIGTSGSVSLGANTSTQGPTGGIGGTMSGGGRMLRNGLNRVLSTKNRQPAELQVPNTAISPQLSPQLSDERVEVKKATLVSAIRKVGVLNKAVGNFYRAAANKLEGEGNGEVGLGQGIGFTPGQGDGIETKRESFLNKGLQGTAASTSISTDLNEKTEETAAVVPTSPTSSYQRGPLALPSNPKVGRSLEALQPRAASPPTRVTVHLSGISERTEPPEDVPVGTESQIGSLLSIYNRDSNTTSNIGDRVSRTPESARRSRSSSVGGWKNNRLTINTGLKLPYDVKTQAVNVEEP